MKTRLSRLLIMQSLILVFLVSIVTPIAGGEPEKDVEAAIRTLNEAFPTHDPEKIKALMVPTHLAFTPWGGKHTREQQVATLKDLVLDKYSAGPMTITMIGNDGALVTYGVTVSGRFTARNGICEVAQEHRLTAEWRGKVEDGRALSFLTVFIPMPEGTTKPPTGVALHVDAGQASVVVDGFRHSFPTDD